MPDSRLGATSSEPFWQRLGPVGTLLLIAFLTVAILFILLSGLFLFAALNGFSSDAAPPPLRAVITLSLYALALLAAMFAFAQKQRLWPLLAVLALAIVSFCWAMQQFSQPLPLIEKTQEEEMQTRPS